MITNVDLIRDALSLINVIGVEESVVEPGQSEHALRKQNALLAQWKTNEIDLQYYPQTMDQLGDPCPIPEDAELAVTYYLAFGLAPHYGKQVSPEMIALAKTYYDDLLNKAISDQIKPVTIDRPFGDAQSGNFDIVTGYS